MLRAPWARRYSSITDVIDGTSELLSFARFWHRRDVTAPSSWSVAVTDARADERYDFAGRLTDSLDLPDRLRTHLG